MNRHMEKLYDLYCDTELMKTLNANGDCMEELQERYNTSDCARNPEFKREYFNAFKNVCF